MCLCLCLCFAPGADLPFASLLYDVGFDPDLSFAAAMGGLINQGGPTFNSTGYFSALGPWEVRLMIGLTACFLHVF